MYGHPGMIYTKFTKMRFDWAQKAFSMRIFMPDFAQICRRPHHLLFPKLSKSIH
jgi:hypothetical protein